jgi:SCP-2 sterol transfer family
LSASHSASRYSLDKERSIMPVYQNSEQLYNCLRLLFTRIGEEDIHANKKVAASRLVMRMRCKEPSAEVVIDGRSNQVKITYGASKLHPDLDLEVTADALHYILLGQMNLTKAIGSGSLKFRGPVWKSFVMEDIFHRGQAIYPQILRECNPTLLS